MTLTIHQEEDEQRQLLVKVEVEEKRVAEAMRKAARELGREVHVPGFRKGRAPYRVIEKRIGRDALRAEAIDDMVPGIFDEIVAETKVELYAQPRLDDMEVEPLVLNFVLPLAPNVTLGEYRELRKEVVEIEVTEEAVADALEHVRTHHEELEDVDRAVETGDKVTLSGKGQFVPQEGEAEEPVAEAEEPVAEAVEEEETAVDEAEPTDDSETSEEEPAEENSSMPANAVIFEQESIAMVMDTEQLFFGEDFVNNIVGMSAGEEKTFTINFADDFDEEDYAGREATFTIEILNVQNRTLPELDDELAKQEGDYETLEELRSALEKEIYEQAESQAKDELIEGMIDDLVEDMSIVFPPAAVEAEIDDMVANLKSQVERSGWQWEDFVTMGGQDEGQMREGFRESGETRLKRQLALRQFVLEEKILVTAEDIDAAIDEKVARFGSDELRDNMRNYYKQGQSFNMLSSEILVDKAYGRMKAVLSGNAPDLAELESEASTDEEE